MRLVVAEKPSVAREIAAVIGADKYVGGDMRGNGADSVIRDGACFPPESQQGDPQRHT